MLLHCQRSIQCVSEQIVYYGLNMTTHLEHLTKLIGDLPLLLAQLVLLQAILQALCDLNDGSVLDEGHLKHAKC